MNCNYLVILFCLCYQRVGKEVGVALCLYPRTIRRLRLCNIYFTASSPRTHYMRVPSSCEKLLHLSSSPHSRNTSQECGSFSPSFCSKRKSAGRLPTCHVQAQPWELLASSRGQEDILKWDTLHGEHLSLQPRTTSRQCSYANPSCCSQKEVQSLSLLAIYWLNLQEASILLNTKRS